MSKSSSCSDIRCLLEMDDRPLPAERGCAQSAVGIDGDRMPERGEKRGIVMRVGVAPAIRQIDSLAAAYSRAPRRFFVARHDRLGEPAGGATAAEDQSVRGEVGDSELARERRDDEVRRPGHEHRIDSGLAIRVDQLDRARKKMADQDALAIFLAQREQPVARDALEGLEQRDVQQPPIALLREVQAREARRESEQIADAPAPFAEVGEDEDGRMEQVEIDQRAVEIVEGGATLCGWSLGRVAVAMLSCDWKLTCQSSFGPKK